MTKHTFVICAYKESPYLGACIRSLQRQTVPSRIVMVTGTPNDYLFGMAEEYGVELVINTGKTSITDDWNFGLSQVTTKYATIAHQDDVYAASYVERMVAAAEKKKKPVIAFSDYGELKGSVIAPISGMLKIKELMLLPMRLPRGEESRFIRRRVLSMGNPIPCPSVMYCMDRITLPLFQDHFTADEDWEAWEKLSKEKGSFVYVPKRLMLHRIHEDSTTHKMFEENKRTVEDLEMFRKFWPKPVAKLINRFYSKAADYE